MRYRHDFKVDLGWLYMSPKGSANVYQPTMETMKMWSQTGKRMEKEAKDARPTPESAGGKTVQKEKGAGDEQDSGKDRRG